jgi:UDP-N-acetylmuramoyl-tripeptide--D-alanyl-D-alanine ligase
VIGWDAARVAAAAGAHLVAAPPARAGAERGPSRAVIDSRAAGPGDLFVGLPGENVDGGAFAVHALAAGAWGVLVEPAHAEAARCAAPGALLAHPDPLRGLQALARAWRRALGARVVAITGSTGKTSTKDILAALLGAALPTASSPANLNTEIGLPLAVLEAPPGTQALVLEMAMRGAGQIAELVTIAEPDVGVIVNVGPVHLELLGSLEAVAAAKAELIDGLAPGATAVIPAREPLLDGHRRADLRTVTFGETGDVVLAEVREGGEVIVRDSAGEMALRPSFAHAYNLRNLLAAVAAARALGVTPHGRLDVTFSSLRGERLALPGGVMVINDCYNANPMSMRAALDDLSESAAGRRVAVLGDMLELGADECAFHEQVGAHAASLGIEVMVTVGPLAAAAGRAFGPAHAVADAAAAAALLGDLLREGDTVLVKGSRGVGLERVAQALAAGPGPAGPGPGSPTPVPPPDGPARPSARVAGTR